MRFAARSLSLLVLAAAWAAAPCAARADDASVSVPSFVSLDEAQAREAAERAGLTLRVVEVAGPAVGRVESQQPVAGADVPRGTPVVVRVGIAARVRTSVPDVHGQSAEDALATLASAYDVHVVRVTDDRARPGHVIRTEPRAGSDAWLRAPLTLYVAERERVEPAVADGGFPPPAPRGGAEGPGGAAPARAVALPDLRGRTHAEAERALVDLGLVPRPWFVLPEAGAAPWQVVAQRVTAGTEVPAGTRVDFRVALPREREAQARVPHVVGLTSQEAARVLLATGHVVVRPVSGPGDEAREVTAQEPAAGSVVPRDTRVRLDLAGEAPPTAPAAERGGDGSLLDRVGGFFKKVPREIEKLPGRIEDLVK